MATLEYWLLEKPIVNKNIASLQFYKAPGNRGVANNN